MSTAGPAYGPLFEPAPKPRPPLARNHRDAEDPTGAGPSPGPHPATPAGSPTATPAEHPPGTSTWPSPRRALPALIAFAVARLAGLVAVTLWAHYRGGHPRDLLGLTWDGLWYHRIAGWGYGTFIPGAEAPGLRYSDLAFFPLYPMTVRTVDTVLPIGSVTAALLVAWVCAGLAAWGVFAVTDHCYGRRTATAVVLVWALLPHAIVLSMAYTESMMCALAAWALYATLTRRWLAAGLLSALAGLCRPNAAAVASAVVVAVLADAWRRRRDGLPQQPRAWLAAVIAPLGWLGYVGWAGWQTEGGPGGIPGGYFALQRRWGSRYDFGRYALGYLEHLALARGPLAAYPAAAVCAAAVLLLALAVLDRMPLPLLVYSAALVAIALGGANFFFCKPRFLLPAFPLLVPCAAALARARPRAAAVAVVTLAGLSLGYGAYLLTLVTVPL
ncbi:glycosyltransferase family 39 protein [Streptomyces sp. NBC_01190]|uniref:glycosyltransferase family 39 protein n=1 Tax=Streptomyces sp. NBC_01190 TaxID=2903767 RepID=UPI00386A59BE|nr:glycosyltransferase family 39 protein [Streptomyces sp. NBC_01190]